MIVTETMLVIPGVPMTLPRPRAAVVAGQARVYTPSKAKDWQHRIAVAAQQVFPEPLHGPLSMDVEFWFPMKGTPRKREPRPAQWKTTRGDLDNLVKMVCDGLQFVAFEDDAQVCELTARKLHAAQGSVPKTVVRIGEAPCLDGQLGLWGADNPRSKKFRMELRLDSDH